MKKSADCLIMKKSNSFNGDGGIPFTADGPASAFVQLAPSSREETVCASEPAAASIPEARRYPVAFHRAGLMAMEMIRRSHVAQVVATADARSDVAVRWLKPRLSLSTAVSTSSTLIGIMRTSAHACPGLFFHVYGTCV